MMMIYSIIMVYNYVDVIESYGIKYENIYIHKLDMAQYDDKLVLAMITAIIRSDRINEGLIMSMIENGSFREDLFYRINTIEINIPPLRERGNDIIMLAEHFTEKYSQKYNKKVPRITREAKQLLLKYSWPGNVRELQHIIERAVILGNGLSLHPDDFALKQQQGKSRQPANLNLKEIEQQAIEEALKISEGNMNKAAQMLGITRYALYRKLK